MIRPVESGRQLNIKENKRGSLPDILEDIKGYRSPFPQEVKLKHVVDLKDRIVGVIMNNQALCYVTDSGEVKNPETNKADYLFKKKVTYSSEWMAKQHPMNRVAIFFTRRSLYLLDLSSGENRKWKVPSKVKNTAHFLKVGERFVFVPYLEKFEENRVTLSSQSTYMLEGASGLTFPIYEEDLLIGKTKTFPREEFVQFLGEGEYPKATSRFKIWNLKENKNGIKPFYDACGEDIESFYYSKKILFLSIKIENGVYLNKIKENKVESYKYIDFNFKLDRSSFLFRDENLYFIDKKGFFSVYANESESDSMLVISEIRKSAVCKSLKKINFFDFKSDEKVLYILGLKNKLVRVVWEFPLNI